MLLLAGGFTVLCSVPGSFVPEEDQGFAIGMVMMPPGTSQPRTREFMNEVSAKLQQNEAVHSVFEVAGFSFIGGGESVGMFFIKLKDFGDRKADRHRIHPVGERHGVHGHARRHGVLRELPDDRRPRQRSAASISGSRIVRRRGGRRSMARWVRCSARRRTNNPSIGSMQPNELPPAPQLNLKVDRTQAESMGLSISDVYAGVQLMLAPVYVNDFMFEGRVLRVTMQADAPYRMNDEALPAVLSTRGHRLGHQ